MATWREERAEQRRQDAAAAAERRRQDAVAAAETQAVQDKARAETAAIQERARLEALRVELELKDKRDREKRREQERDRATRRARRTARLKALRTWASEHMGDLFIYPLAIASAWLAIPAMARFGEEVYSDASGKALPIITELGMWAFAFAVQITRLRTPDRPVWALQVGVWTFAAIGASLNFLDGVTREPSDVGHGIVMAVVSVAGVVAHQLVSASPRRSRAERDHLKVARHAAKKITAARKAVIDHSITKVDQTGDVVLVFSAGNYNLTKRKLAPIAPDQPATDIPLSEVDRELAETVEKWRQESPTGTPTDGSTLTPTAPSTLTPIATPPIDPDSRGDQQQSTPTDRTSRPDQSTPSRGDGRGRGRVRGRAGQSARGGPDRQARSIDQLKAELKAAVEAGEVDPTSAESIRKGLNVGQSRARELRDTYSG